MCHTQESRFFPSPQPTGQINDEIEALIFGSETAQQRLVLMPDIYGMSAFYQGLATRLANKGAQVFLVNPFAGHGELPEPTREAAFARRHKVSDKQFLDTMETFCQQRGINGVIGFCLGGYYIFELARRQVPQDLVGFYGFPQGMENRDPLPKPFDYLSSITKQHTCLMPGDDQVVGTGNVTQLAELAQSNPAISLRIYAGSGHGFLKDLDGDDGTLRDNAIDALNQCERALGL
jgi:carboxymethylenebutenolidase